MTFRAKEGGGLIVNGEEHLRLPCGLKPAHQFLPPSGVSMRGFASIVQPLVSPVVGSGAQLSDRDAIAAQLVSDEHTGIAPVFHKLFQKTLGRTGHCGGFVSGFQAYRPWRQRRAKASVSDHRWR